MKRAFVNVQQLGRALMLPIAVLPIAGLLLRLGQPDLLGIPMLAAAGALVAFEISPFVNLTRVIPVVNVIDNRRLTLWVAFALVMLGAHGVDAVGASRLSRRWSSIVIALACALLIGSMAIAGARPWLLAKARAHYAPGASSSIDPVDAEARAKEAEAAQQQQEGIPLYWGWGPGPVLWPTQPAAPRQLPARVR